MSTQQTDALQCAADLEYSIPRHRIQDAFILNAYKALKMVRTQHARIAELESQLAQRFDAADMATAAAQGFRVGATAPAQPVAEPARPIGYLNPKVLGTDGKIDAHGVLTYSSRPCGGWTFPIYAAAPAQPAAQQGVAYAALPEPYCNAHDDADACYPDMFSEQQMRAFADATHTLRASHGQALRLLTQKEKDSLGRRAEGMDGNEWDQWVQEKFAQVNGLKVQGGSYERDWE